MQHTPALHVKGQGHAAQQSRQTEQYPSQSDPSYEDNWSHPAWFLRRTPVALSLLGVTLTILGFQALSMALLPTPPLHYLVIILPAFGALICLVNRWAGLMVSTSGAVAAGVLSVESIGTWAAVVFSVFFFARMGAHAVWATSGTTLVVFSALFAGGSTWKDSTLPALASALCVTAGALGSVLRLQQAAWVQAQNSNREQASVHRANLRRAITEERLLIARDLHDAVGHEVAVVSMHVGVAQVSTPAEFEAAHAALNGARSGLYRTLQETQQILRVLRDESSKKSAYIPEMPSVEHIPALLNRSVGDGLSVVSSIEDRLPRVTADVSAAAYRIVQESLTNARKHGRGGAEIRVECDSGWLRIIIENEVRRGQRLSRAAENEGFGLIGMRERARSAGAKLTVGLNDDRFTVVARFPPEQESSDDQNPNC